MYVNEIIEAKRPTVLAITGGGTEAFGHLLREGGASSYFIEGLINYSHQSTDELLGSKPEHYASDDTARRLAVAAYNRCRKLTGDDRNSHGIAATAKLRYEGEREDRKHEIHVAYHNWFTTHSSSKFINSETYNSRVSQEGLCTSFILQLIHNWYTGKNKFPVHFDTAGSPIYGEVALNNEQYTIHSFKGKQFLEEDSLIFPGSFNPMHEGHLNIAETAAKKLFKPVWLELSITNTDKPQLDFIEIKKRIHQIEDFCKESKLINGIIVSNSPLFLDKSKIYPKGSMFVVGADTYRKIGSTKYLDPIKTLEQLQEKNQVFLVFPRPGEQLYQNPVYPISNFVYSDYVPINISSTEIRKALYD